MTEHNVAPVPVCYNVTSGLALRQFDHKAKLTSYLITKLTRLTCIRQTSCSNLRRWTSYPDPGFAILPIPSR